MGSQLLPAAAAPPAKPPSIPFTITTSTTTAANGTTTTTTKTTSTSADGTTTITTTTTTTTTITTTSTGTATAAATTISSLSEDDLREIFLRLPIPEPPGSHPRRAHLPRMARRRPLLPALPPPVPRPPPGAAAPLIGLFIPIDGSVTPSFAPLRRRSDPDVTAALRGGDFFLTSLPLEADPPKGWSLMDSRDGYLLLWNMMSVAAVNPLTWAVDIIPLPGVDVQAGSRHHFSFLGFRLLCSDEHPSSFRVVRVCLDKRRIRAAVFSSETWDWVVHPWVHVGGDRSLKFNAGTLVNGSVYWPVHGEHRMIRINTTTMDISSVDLPSEVKVYGFNFSAGDTKDGQLCIVYGSDFFLHVWIRGVDGDGIEIWVPHIVIDLSPEIDRVTHGFALEVVEVRSGYIYLSTTCLTPAGTLHCWFFSLSLETLVLELLVSGKFDGCAPLYNMAWPPSLLGDDGTTGHEVEGSQKSSAVCHARK